MADLGYTVRLTLLSRRDGQTTPGVGESAEVGWFIRKDRARCAALSWTEDRTYRWDARVVHARREEMSDE